MMKCEELQKLENFGIAIIVDAFTSSKKIIEEYEQKYGLSSSYFYETY